MIIQQTQEERELASQIEAAEKDLITKATNLVYNDLYNGFWTRIPSQLGETVTFKNDSCPYQVVLHVGGDFEVSIEFGFKRRVVLDSGAPRFAAIYNVFCKDYFDDLGKKKIKELKAREKSLAEYSEKLDSLVSYAAILSGVKREPSITIGDVIGTKAEEKPRVNSWIKKEQETINIE